MSGFEKVLCTLIVFLLLHLEFPASAQSKSETQTGDSSSNECGTLKKDYLFNEQSIAEINEYPWIAKISSPNRSNILCSGTLYNKRNLIVAAHCVFNNDIKYIVRFDDYEDPKQGLIPQIYDVVEVVVHPNYTRRSFDNNIALLTLGQDARYSVPICLLPKYNDDYIGQRLEVVGFLHSDINIKKKTIAHITSHLHCSQLFPKSIQISNNDICGFVHSGVRLVSGAALMGVEVVNGDLQSFYLIGVLTNGLVDNSKLKPNLFMRITTHRDWILYNSYRHY